MANIVPNQNSEYVYEPEKPVLNSEVSFHPERPIVYTPIGNEPVKVYVWELPVRIFHWVNMLAILLLMGTGIYIGKPFVAASIHEEAYYSYLMGWARYIHFFSAFLFTVNLIFRLYWAFRGNKFATSNPFRLIFWKETVETVKFYLFQKNKKPHYAGHNPLAQLSYWIFIGLGSWIVMLTGFYMYFEPQFNSFWGSLFTWVAHVFGGDSFSVRSWHHLTAWGFMVFTVIHVYMAFRDDYLERNGSVSSMITGYKVEPKKVVGGKNEK
ncbi:Ni/Fe-hydrogenase, b-type cytochrome subunit [Bacillus sp. B-jedd]|uniref:Ni/Fe-hydrogenase, b-type cytochrome subunit n=1 Tax=Bacillus sp. B-jedd TaxID=1476857 RepID=UPI00051560D8|nr:Ni/Fe-hydrogenase, b-type cytochrome subunit [Bacillus sp. B-jedd]CEG27555.1 putative Ni/Fe-hydrogenase B-type cytochrome subunit [Bacillus sp. B-jedd]